MHQSGGELSGFVAFYCNDSKEKLAFITLVLTNRSYRGNRIAGGLVDGVLSIAKKRGFKACRLEVKKENIDALSLYKKKGFDVIRDENDIFLMEVKFD